MIYYPFLQDSYNFINFPSPTFAAGKQNKKKRLILQKWIVNHAMHDLDILNMDFLCIFE